MRNEGLKMVHGLLFHLRRLIALFDTGHNARDTLTNVLAISVTKLKTRRVLNSNRRINRKATRGLGFTIFTNA